VQSPITNVPDRFAGVLAKPPIATRDGVLDYVEGSGADYCGNFGDQWNRFREIQIDSLSGKAESHQRFFAETGFDREWLRGKLVLDAGCGAGRFAEVAAECGAFVVAVDLSTAAYACARTLDRFPPSQYRVVRADLRDLPFNAGVFDAIYSLGVLQHTPDPLGTMAGLARFLAPGAKLATWIYEKRNPDINLVFPRTWVRALVRRWDLRQKLALSRILTAVFFPAGWLLSWFGRTGERVSQFLPYAARHHLGRGSLARQWHYCVMDTLDWYGPEFDLPQSEDEVRRAMARAGLVDVKRLPARGMAIVGRAAERT
jgi:SAM-dependent methyltransferase